MCYYLSILLIKGSTPFKLLLISYINIYYPLTSLLNILHYYTSTYDNFQMLNKKAERSLLNLTNYR